MHYRAICISRHIRGRTVGVTTAKVAPGVILPSHQYLAFGFFYPSPPRPLLYEPRGIHLCGICLAIPAVAGVLVAVRLAFFGGAGSGYAEYGARERPFYAAPFHNADIRQHE
jgi:hypothetical protein